MSSSRHHYPGLLPPDQAGDHGASTGGDQSDNTEMETTASDQSSGTQGVPGKFRDGHGIFGLFLIGQVDLLKDWG